MADRKAMLEAAGTYLKQHPEELVRAARNLIALRLGVPLDALRWLVGQARGKRVPKNVEIDAVPPGVRLGATLELMNTPIRASAIVYVEGVGLSASELRVELRLAEVKLKVLDDTAESPVAALIRSGALDLSKPGNLAAFMPKRPAVLVEAVDDRLVLDLKRHPKLASNEKLERALRLLAPVVTVASIATDDDHLDLALRAFPEGFAEAVGAIRGAL
jgi:hypothetical protein